MRIPANMTDDELREAHRAADTLTTDKYRAYLPGRLLPLLIARFRDDVAEALGMQLPSLPQRSAVRAVTLTGSVVVLVTRFAACMDDPALAPALRDFRDALVIEKADRARIADELMEKARAS
jgi:hypothetical protein